MFCKWLGEGTTICGIIIEVLTPLPPSLFYSGGLPLLTARRRGKDTMASFFRLSLPSEVAQMTTGSV